MKEELIQQADLALDQVSQFAERVNWRMVGRELAVFGTAAITAYGQMYYHITRFARDALRDIPFGDFMTQHAGNMGPSADIGMWGALAGEVVKTIGQSKENNLLVQFGDKVIPALTLAYIYHLNQISEAGLMINPEGDLDKWSGVAFGVISILAIKGIANRIRHAPHEIAQDNS